MAARIQMSFDRAILSKAVADAFKKLHPVYMLKNPVMFVTEVGAALTTLAMVFRAEGEPLGFTLQIALWLWFTVLFANFAEAVAEGRGKAQANALRKTRTRTIAHRRVHGGADCQDAPADQLRKVAVLEMLRIRI